ncbi:MAG: sigma-54-dependent transcriptional regulator [Planctomycetota bacterium]|jgi:DNA-binding NtrC family response regulator
MKKMVLSNENRQFFKLVADIPAINPFSPSRAAIDEEISGIHEVVDRHQRVLYAAEAIRQRLALLDTKGVRQFQDFDDRDRELMRYTFLFDVYHSCTDLFDAFIAKQEASGKTPLKVPFARKAIDALLQRGFTEKEVEWCFAMFYQIRRAFYFIDRGLIGRSDCMRQLRMGLWNNLFTYDARGYERHMWDKMEDFSLLLEGPTGCGKGAAAAAIGRSGFIPFDMASQTFKSSFTTTFIPLNLSQFAEGLLESELFGHTKGAFTGAVESHEGVLGLCGPHGSIFLDEIGEISIPAQVKLLKVLEERIFSPVGSHEKLRFYGRVIAATNRPVDILRTEGTFRDDFYYRLCSDCIQVPPLAQRVQENPDELAELVEHFTSLITGRKSMELTARVLETIDKQLGKQYPWPGNVRELAQCIRRVILKRNYEGQKSKSKNPQDQLKAGIDSGTLTADELLGGYCKMLYDRCGTYEEVAKLTAMDRRTVKKRVREHGQYDDGSKSK